MTNLFLYGLGFGCLLIFALLIWDAYISKRRMRNWAEDWKPPDSSVSDNSATSGAVLLKRRTIFKPTFLIIMVATMMVVMIKRHSSARDQHQTVNASLESQNDDAGHATFDAGNLLSSRAGGDSWNFATALALSDSTRLHNAYNGNASGWPEDFAWIATDELSLKPDTDFNSLAAISLNLGLSTDESGGDVTSVGNVDAGINCDLGMMTEMRLDCSLNGSLLSDSGNTKGLNTAVNSLP